MPFTNLGIEHLQKIYPKNFIASSFKLGQLTEDDE